MEKNMPESRNNQDLKGMDKAWENTEEKEIKQPQEG